MSDFDSTAATQATPFSPIQSSHPSPKSSQDSLTPNGRSPSPAERSLKRRRLDSSFPENRFNSNHHNQNVDLDRHPTFMPSQSAPGLLSPFNGIQPFEPQPRSFLGHDREFISVILSTRGVAHRPSAKADTWPLEKGRCIQRSFTFPQ